MADISVTPAPPQIHRPTSQLSSKAQSLAEDSSSSDIDSKWQPKTALSRPILGSRKSSGTLVISRDSPVVQDEQYDQDDARAMSPRRNSEEIDKMSDVARAALEEQANSLQSNLLEIIERVDSVKSEHEKLESGNKFLQSYIGELMSTSKIVSATATKTGKAKRGRSGK